MFTCGVGRVSETVRATTLRSTATTTPTAKSLTL